MATLHQPYPLAGGGTLTITLEADGRPLTGAELALVERLVALVERSEVRRAGDMGG